MFGLKPYWSGAGRIYLLMVAPRFFKWKMLSLSGLNALLFLQCLIALITMFAENVCHLHWFPLGLARY